MSSSTQDPLHRSGALAALARACAGHPVRTLVVWVTTFVAVVLSANLFGGTLVNEFTIPGSETQSAVDLLEEKFPERAGDAAQIVFTDEEPPHQRDCAAGHRGRPPGGQRGRGRGQRR